MSDNDRVLTPDQRQLCKGKAMESLVAATCILPSDGELNVAAPLIDDGGVDLIFFRQEGQAALSVQVKARFADARVVDRDNKVQVNFTDTTFRPRRDFFLLILVVDPHTADIKQAWLVPSVEFAANRSERAGLRFSVSIDGTENQWAEFRVSKDELASRILGEIDRLEKSAG